MPEILLDQASHIYTVDGAKVPGVTKILGDLGLIDFSMVPEDIMRRACQYGNALHKTLEYEDRGILKKYDENLQNDLDAWRCFKMNYQVEFLPEGIERKLYSKRWGFCGTLDRIAHVMVRRAPKLTIIDIKSSAQFHPAVRLQTAGYKIGYEEETKKKVQGRMAVRLNGDGSYKVECMDDPNDEHAWIAACQLYHWKKRNIKNGGGK